MLWYLGTQEQNRRKKQRRDEYKDLRVELRRLRDKPVEIVPIIIGALGTIHKSLKRNLEEFGADVGSSPRVLQKIGMLETLCIIRRGMNS